MNTGPPSGRRESVAFDDVHLACSNNAGGCRSMLLGG